MFDKIRKSAAHGPPSQDTRGYKTTGRHQSLLEQALGCESAELARLYVGEIQLADIVDRAEQAAQAQLRTVFQLRLDQQAEFERVFAVKLKQFMKEPCGGDLEAPRIR